MSRSEIRGFEMNMAWNRSKAYFLHQCDLQPKRRSAKPILQSLRPNQWIWCRVCSTVPSPFRTPSLRSSFRSTLCYRVEPLNKLTGSAVGPTEILTGRRRTQEAKGVPLPPKGRSPIKTALGSSPRRQSGITSATARRHTSRTPDRPSSQSLVNRRLDFKSSGQRQSFKGMEDQEDELEAEPPISSPAQRTIRIPRPERPDVFDLRPSSVEEDDEDYSQVHDASHDAAEPQLVDEQNSLLINGVSDEYASNADADGSLQLLDDQADATIPASRHKRLSQATPSQNVKGDEGRRRGRPRKSNPESSLLQPDSNSKSASTGRSRGMVNGVVAKNAQSKQSSNKNGTMKNTSNGENMPKSSKLLKGNTVLPESSEVLYDQGENEGMDDSALERDDTTGMHVDESLSQHSNDGSRSKKRLHDDVDDSASQKKRKRQSLPPPAQRDPKAKVSGVKGKNASKANRQEQRKYRADEVPTRPKSSHVIRQGTPMDEPGAHVTRYGRASFKPLAWYRGEGVRWSQRSSRDELPGVQEIVRVEDTLPLPVKRPKKRGRKRKGSVMSTVDEVEEEPEDWEKNDGFLMGTALGWDSIEDDVTNEDVDFCEFLFYIRLLRWKFSCRSCRT